MARRTEIVVIKTDHRERVVKVTVDAPYPEELDIQYLARKALMAGKYGPVQRSCLLPPFEARLRRAPQGEGFQQEFAS